MTEPTNPLFEDEKEFLERKKLEYERALLGDVEEIKEQTLQVGKVALVGAGIVGGIWLLSKVFGGRKPKKKHKKHRRSFDTYAGSGFDGFDENDQELDELATGLQDTDYTYDDSDGFSDEPTDDGFSFDEAEDTDELGDIDDNGLSNYPDFPAHSAPTHGFDEATHDDAAHVAEDNGYDEGPAHSFASPSSYQARPYDDSRRLPDSDSFAEPEEDEDAFPAAAPEAAPKRSLIGPALLAFAKSETGRVIAAQAAAVALALVTKAVQGILPKYGEETDKNADLATSTTTAGIQPAAWPATSAAQDASAAARHDDNLTPRAPLA